MARAAESDTRTQPLSKSEVLAACRGFQTGRRLQNRGYVQGKHLSCGATGEVFLGRVPASCPEYGALSIDSSQVALKHMRAINAAIQRQIQQEISVVFHCRAKYAEEVGDPVSPGHPCLVAYLDWFAGPTGLDREVYLVMELCSFSLADMIFAAGNLRADFDKNLAAQRRAYSNGAAADGCVKILSEPGRFRFPESEVLQVLRNLLSALTFLHRHGVAHRDVKSENILWAQGCYKLADFGTAVLLDDAAKRRDETGTLWIMAPELLGRRPYGLNCDIWSLGVVLFEVATLGKPFNSKELLAYRNSPEALAPKSFWSFLLGGHLDIFTFTGLQGATNCGPQIVAPLGQRHVLLDNYWENASDLSPLEAMLPMLAHSCYAARLGSTVQQPLANSGEGRGGQGQAGHNGGKTEWNWPKWIGVKAKDILQERQLAFLKKRSSFRWIYSEELKILVFEELLCEDPDRRPAAFALAESTVLQNLVDRAAVEAEAEVPPDAVNGTDSPEGLLRCMRAENMLRALALRKGRPASDPDETSDATG
ncbi:Pak5 [Symbiodinium sp. KB8]|nr:Pak5 [Symbiodinium sp. KB8]